MNHHYGTRACHAVASFAVLLFCAASSSGQNISLGEASNFGLLGLENGSVIINSATKIIGDVGYSAGVVSTTNQKAEDFTGGAYVHSTATFSYQDKNFFPSDGILTGPAVDARLDQANADVLLLASSLSSLTPTQSFGFLGDDDSLTINSTGNLNVIDIAGLNYKSDTLTLSSRAGLTDTFIIRVSGNFDFDQSFIQLDGITAAHVLFYFPGASTIDINKSGSEFRGTILAPYGSVEYHNPAIFEGAIIASSINVHSDFNLTHVPFIPEPSASGLLAVGLLFLATRRRRTA
jgi:choice-of-anchor A domain-containing protein